jgi:hypothetical protein
MTHDVAHLDLSYFLWQMSNTARCFLSCSDCSTYTSDYVLTIILNSRCVYSKANFVYSLTDIFLFQRCLLLVAYLRVYFVCLCLALPISIIKHRDVLWQTTMNAGKTAFSKRQTTSVRYDRTSHHQLLARRTNRLESCVFCQYRYCCWKASIDIRLWISTTTLIVSTILLN